MLNEFRQDLVSGHWVLFSTDRMKRPHAPETKPKEKFYQPKDKCPFENPQASSNGQPILVYNKGQKVDWEGEFNGDWTTQVIKNKYPALKDGLCGPAIEYGPFRIAEGNGFHEIVITRDHDKNFIHFNDEETSEVIKVYRDRYNAISQNECGDYIQIIHNHGPSAGASLYHNHSQIISTPILPPDVMGSIRGSMEYFRKHNQKVHDVLIAWEIQKEKRIVFQNEYFVVLCPFVSRTPYEMRIYPKTSNPCFQNIEDGQVLYFSQALNVALKKLAVVLDDPDYNFFIHTSPVSSDVFVEYDFYNWHLEIVPHVSQIGGFELGTHIYINSVDPDDAAEKLRNAEV